MNRRQMMQALAALPMIGPVAAADAPGDVWTVVARKPINSATAEIVLRLPKAMAPVRSVRLCAEGCGVWIHEVEAQGPAGRIPNVMSRRHLAPVAQTRSLDFAVPVDRLIVRLSMLPFDDTPVALSLWAPLAAGSA